MPRLNGKILIAMVILLTTSGCCLRRSNPKPCCPQYVTQRSNIEFTTKEPGAEVVFNFENVPRYEDIKRSLFSQLASGTAKISLFEAVSLACRNSELGGLIDAERHAVLCQTDDCRADTIGKVLEGESLERRNQSAGEAAELFLKLVQVKLQQDLTTETTLHLADLETTLAAAADAGFATADGKHELAEIRLRVKATQSELSSLEQKLMYQLNILIGVDRDSLLVFQPVHELAPGSWDFETQAETEFAESNRPGIQSIESVLASGTVDDSALTMLAQFDSRLGVRMLPRPATNIVLRRQMAEFLQQANAPNAAIETRRNQIQQILDFKRKQAHAEASEQLIKIQSSLEKLTIANEDVARINKRLHQLEAKQAVDAQGSYLESNRNWLELQNARSNRIIAAVDLEIAKIKLLQAQGRLVQYCGYDLGQNACLSSN